MADKETILYILRDYAIPDIYNMEEVAERIAALDEGPCDCCREGGCGNGCMCKDDCTCEAIYPGERPEHVDEYWWEDMTRCEWDRGHKGEHFILIPPLDWGNTGTYGGPGIRLKWGEE